MPHKSIFASLLTACFFCSLLLLTQQTNAAPTFTLDGQLDATYGAAIATDPAGDLADPGPNEWSGTQWADLTQLYCGHDEFNLFVYVPLTAYAQAVSSGTIALLVDVNSAEGGTSDPGDWGNAFTFNHGNKPDFVMRGNLVGIAGNAPDDNNGWTQLRSWAGSGWDSNLGNWGGIAGGQAGTNIAYSDGNGVEIKLSLSDLGVTVGDSVNLQFLTSQRGGTKGAFDALPADDQSIGWDDPTAHSAWATCVLGDVPPPPTPDPTNPPTPTATPSAGVCGAAALGDGQFVQSELFHIDTDLAYRNPLGDIEADGSATLTLRTCQDDADSAEILVWQTGDPLAAPSNTYPMAVTSSDGTYDYWTIAVPGPGSVIDQWYQFRIGDDSAENYYHPPSGNSGEGVWSATLQNPSWKLGTIAPPPTPIAPYDVPDWVQDAVIYQIFPDRFRNGDVSNDPVDGTAVYEPGGCAGYPHARPNGASSGCLHDLRSWNDPLLIPSWGLDFYGGDLRGVIQKIDDGYFADLGVNTLYFNPIFEASSNHGYETNDYYAIRDYFGDEATFDELITKANAANLRIILDAVFNHAGMDSKYLDPYNNYPTITGACESASSPYRSWFTVGGNGSTVCDGGWGWTGWYGYATLPEFVDADNGVRDLFFRGGAEGSPDGKSVSQYWLDKGIAGWRYDVAQDITHDFFAEMRPYVKGTNSERAVYGDADYLMLGEVTGGCDWGLYQSYMNENELDSVMNYCFRDWVREFANGDAPSQFDDKYNAFRQLFPQPTFYAMMNLISSHDSPRLLSLVDGSKDRLKLATILQMTLPGAPSVYYGDEVGMSGQGDPDNRRVYPWTDTGGGQNGSSADSDIYAHFKQLIGIRNNHSSLRRGEVATLLVDNRNGVYAYIRYDASETIVVVLNNTGSNVASIDVPLAGYLPDGTQLADLLNSGDSYTTAGGSVTLPVDGRWGAILQTSVVPTSVGMGEISAETNPNPIVASLLMLLTLSCVVLACSTSSQVKAIFRKS